MPSLRDRLRRPCERMPEMWSHEPGPPERAFNDKPSSNLYRAASTAWSTAVAAWLLCRTSATYAIWCTTSWVSYVPSTSAGSLSSGPVPARVRATTTAFVRTGRRRDALCCRGFHLDDVRSDGVTTSLRGQRRGVRDHRHHHWCNAHRKTAQPGQDDHQLQRDRFGGHFNNSDNVRGNTWLKNWA
jgi:hypothetical protein